MASTSAVGQLFTNFGKVEHGSTQDTVLATASVAVAAIPSLLYFSPMTAAFITAGSALQVYFKNQEIKSSLEQVPAGVPMESVVGNPGRETSSPLAGRIGFWLRRSAEGAAIGAIICVASHVVLAVTARVLAVTYSFVSAVVQVIFNNKIALLAIAYALAEISENRPNQSYKYMIRGCVTGVLAAQILSVSMLPCVALGLLRENI